MSLDVLIVDDEKDISDLISEILKEEGFSPRTAANSTEVMERINQKVPGAIILDIWLQGSEIDGLGILELVKKRYPLMPIIVISGHGTIQTAVTAIKLGAYDYIEKPFTHDKLIILLKRACESSKLKRENIDLKAKVIDRTEIVGSSVCITKLKGYIDKIASTSGRVLITGNAGVGKELFARVFHKKSKNSNGPFILFSPTGMSSERVQQELFGDTDKTDLNAAMTKRISIIEAANNGTLYIDEVADLPTLIQTKLLSLIHEGTFEKNGKLVKVDLRIIAATAKNIEAEVEAGRFRKDLYYRLNVYPLNIPDLSEHKEDIQMLVAHFVTQLVKSSGLKHREFSPEAVATLQSYNWPGNIRELRNVVEWSMIMNPLVQEEDRIIKPDMLPQNITNFASGNIGHIDSLVGVMSLTLREAREMFEKQYLTSQMSRFNNNISRTSAFVGMERSALHRKLKLLNIHSGNTKFKEDEDLDLGLMN